VTVGGEAIEFAADEPICTEYSHKYSVQQFAVMAFTAGLSLRQQWTDSNRDFAVLYFEVA